MLTVTAHVSFASVQADRARLLVSVRSLEEARAAVTGGADIVDIKEPAHGPLGRADTAVWESIAKTYTNHYMVTAAAGELVDYFDKPDAIHLLAKLNGRMALTKLGTSRLARRANWQQEFAHLREKLPCPARLVLVGYADDGTGSPAGDELITTTSSHGGQVVMLDTFDKRGPGLMELWNPEQLNQFISQARDANLWVALAGRLSLRQAVEASKIGANVVGVRGAVCDSGDRDALINASRVRDLSLALLNSTLI
jgi:(5-formylfuran-3-yl)methyl phosphate synthase